MDAIPLPEASRLRRVANRTLAVRLSLALLVTTLGVATAFLARTPETRRVALLPPGSSGLVVLDLSASISSDTYSRIGATLRDLVRSGGRFGLVVFSETAYEALPPETASSALKPLIRFFTIERSQTPGVAPSFAENPWTWSFTGGTRISAGLELALRIVRERHLRQPGVILVSDLDDDPADLTTLGDVARSYREAHLPLRVVALNAEPRDLRLFRSFLRSQGDVVQGRLPAQGSRLLAGTATPVALLLAAAAALLALAAHELWRSRLAWGAPA